jgi:uridine kinase
VRPDLFSDSVAKQNLRMPETKKIYFYNTKSVHMEGDMLIIEEPHRRAAAKVVEMIAPEMERASGIYIITVGGESGSGKSTMAASIAEEFKKQAMSSFIFQQDDYFVFPPRTNSETRKKDISWVGPQEVKLDLLDEHLAEIKRGNVQIIKPLVVFGDNSIKEETIQTAPYQVVIAEGTYTTLLINADTHVFIDRDLNDTLEARRKRNREPQDAFLEQVLTIEHNIISAHKELADIIITKDYDIVPHAK